MPCTDALIQMGKAAWLSCEIFTVAFHSRPPIMQSFLLEFSEQISILPDVNQGFLQTNQKVLPLHIFSK